MSSDPRQLLSGSRSLARRVRAEQRAIWFPLLVFALLHRLAGPAAAIGLALLVLAWVERSVALFVVTVGYLVIVLVPVNFGWVLRRPSPWYFLPHLVIYGSVLLLAGIGFALAERTPRPPPA